MASHQEHPPPSLPSIRNCTKHFEYDRSILVNIALSVAAGFYSDSLVIIKQTKRNKKKRKKQTTCDVLIHTVPLFSRSCE